MQWYYAKGGDQVGPLEDHAFHELVRSGQITADTPVWREGMPNWIPYGQVSGRRTPTEPKKKLVLARDAETPEVAPAEGANAAPADGRNGAAAEQPGSTVAGTFIEPLYRGKRWIRFVGILSIVGGALYALSIVGIIVAWLPIWMGLLLNAAAKNIEQAYESGDEIAVVTAMEKLRLYFKIMGVLALVGLVFGAGGILLAILMPALIGARHF
ncbi:MAG: DUF5362 family protein [Lentisphaerae bacterium]|nr:DUF5362 family protein [Lentisphaerota bacterium]